MSGAPGGPARPPWAKRLVRAGGLFLILVSIAFLGRELARNWSAVADWRPGPGGLAVLGALSLGYAAMLLLLAENWHRIVTLFGPESRLRTWRSYTMTLVAKYLPGNVAHLLGRAVMLRGGGLADRHLAFATLFELAVLPLAGLLVLLLGAVVLPAEGMAALVGPRLAPVLGHTPVLGAALVALLIVACLVAGRLWRRRVGAAHPVQGMTASLMLSLIFVMCLGLLFAAVAQVAGGAPPALAGLAGIAAWLVGYATPGAPGGLGPREAALAILLADAGAPGVAVIAALLFRLVTVLGDLACFALGAALLRPRP